jgi:cysteinyl-tRNA synthetase
MALRARFLATALRIVLASTLALACSGSASDDDDEGGDSIDTPEEAEDKETPPDLSTPTVTPAGLGPGFPATSPWTSFYGNAGEMGDLAKVAQTFRVINIDVDPDAGNFTDEQIALLKASGKNRVISYMNVGSCEEFRSYWQDAPGFVSCGSNKAAQLGPYDGYPDEVWMDPSNEDYQKLIVEHVAPRLVARGIDGFYLDNLELLGHDPDEENGPCNAQCRQGGLDLIRKLREKFPDMLIVMQNGTSDVTRLGTTAGVEFRRLLDGIAHEEVYAPEYDKLAEAELLAWKSMNLKSRDGKPFALLVEDYVGDCNNSKDATVAIARSLDNGFSPYVSDESGEQRVVCFWGEPQ